MSIVTNILASLTEPGQMLVFCDDTDISGSPHRYLAPDLRILCAVVMPSERYAVATTAVKQRLGDLGQTEFHATEIVNPSTTSSWKQVPIEERLGALRFLRGLLAEPPTRLHYAYITKGQYEQIRAEAEKCGPVNAGHKAGLKRVFLRCLFERLTSRGSKTVLILDQNKPLRSPAIESWPEGAFLVGGGPIAANSASVPGLQLADMAVFSVGRYLRKRNDIARSIGKPFDLIALETIAALEGRCEDLLSPASLQYT